MLWRICPDMEDELPQASPRGGFTKRHIFGAVFVLLMLLVAAAWWQRAEIADRFVRDYLDKNNIRATYEIERIGFREQRLRNLVIGDPAKPDLVVKQLAIDLSITLGAPKLGAIRATGVRAKGRLVDGKLFLGELDKLRDMESTEPLTLPDINLDLKDAALSLVTPWGGIGIAVAGSGNLRDRFDGQVVARSRKLDAGGCTFSGTGYKGAVRIRNVRPEFTGPLSAQKANCEALTLTVDAPLLNGKVQFTESVDRWIGDVAFEAKSARQSGRLADAIGGKLNFNGDAERTTYQLALDNARLKTIEIEARKLSGGAEGNISFGQNGFALTSRGNAALGRAALAKNMLPSMQSLVEVSAATPIGPVVARLVPALGKALSRFDGSLNFDFALVPQSQTIGVERLFLRSDNGLILRQESSFTLKDGRLSSPVSLSMNGGDLPTGRLQLRPQGNGWAGDLALQPYSAPGGSMSIPRLSFEGGGRRPWRFSGQAVLTGPLVGGTVTALSLPISGSVSGGSFTMNANCTDVRYASLVTASLRLPAGSLRACPRRGSILQLGGGETRFAFVIPSISVSGSLGEAPLRASGSAVSFDLDSGFGADNVAIDLGRGENISRFTMARFDGLLEGPGVRGTIKGGAGQIGTVPLLIGEADGQWSYSGDVLGFDSTLFITDAAEVDRFNRLKVPNFQLSLTKNRISAIGDLVEPESGVKVADAQISHDLGNSRGDALLSVDGLKFDDRLQPEKITPLTLGHIAQVKGAISGDGRFDWDGDNVTSRGRFTIAPTDLSAAFGPVDGLQTEIVFTDLLGMVTEAGQVASIKIVNPGIPAFDGIIRYQLLPDQKVRIEEGRWPFYGGELILEGTTLDLDVEAKRELTFRLVGLDAEKFLAGYEIENLRVAGVFDGTLPMVFDQQGGRIVGGSLVSRPGGGELSYLGELSYEDMGAMANFAFAALRSIQFDQMQIGVSGNLGGEVVTEVSFRGLQQGSIARRNFITQQLAKLPIEFNVRIEAEFLSLIGNIRSIYDGEYAAQRYRQFVTVPPPVPGEGEGADKQ